MTTGTVADPETGRERHIDHIDGLRAVAVLAVIAYHLDESWVPGGFAGVDVFFVISGFVVSGSLARAHGPQLRRYLVGFYARRVRRIAPALVVMLLVTSVFAALLIPPAWLSDTNDGTGFRAFLGISNLFLASTAGNYFAPEVEFNPYTHTWSLGVEEQFYVAFPLIFFLWSAGRPRLSFVVLAVVAAASLAWAARVQAVDPAAAFYLITTRFWELGVGALLFQLMAARPGRDGRGWAAGAWLAAAATLGGLWLARPGEVPFPDALLPVLGTAGLLATLPHGGPGHPVRRLLASRTAVVVGRASYSLYLWHWPVFVLLRWTIGLEGAPERAVALALTAALSFVSYRYVEMPFRTHPRIVRAPRLAVVGVGVAAVLVSALAYRGITDAREALSRSVVVRNAQDWYPNGPGVPGEAACDRAAVAGGTLTVYGCDARRSLFVVGDSHALAYETMLRRLAERGGWRVHLYAKGGCTVLSLRPGGGDGGPDCAGFAEGALLDMARRARRGDVALFSSLRLPRLSDEYSPGDILTDAEMRAMRPRTGLRGVEESRARRLLAPVRDAGVRLVFEAPPPLFRAAPFRCADWFNRANPVCDPGFAVDRPTLLAYRRPVLDSFERLDVEVWDPFPVLCPVSPCRAFRGGRPLYFDGDHLTAYANRLLLPAFTEHVERAG